MVRLLVNYQCLTLLYSHLLGNVVIIQKKFLLVTNINLGDASNERERECIFIPLKIAKRKHCKERG